MRATKDVQAFVANALLKAPSKSAGVHSELWQGALHDTVKSLRKALQHFELQLSLPAPIIDLVM